MRLKVVAVAVALAALVTATLAEPNTTSEGGQSSRTKETRTALHVARSLDPADMEEMRVRTRTGETATLLVKRRERDRDGRRVALPFVRPPHEAHEPHIRDAKAAVPDPVTVRSTPVLVKGHQQGEWEKRARSVTSVDEDGVPVVEGVRVPDDPIDKTMVWRNARVIDGKLVPYEKTQAKHGGSDEPRPNEIQWTKLEPVRPNAWHGVDKLKRPAVQVAEEVEPATRLDVRDRILEYIKRINAQEVTSRAQARARAGGHGQARSIAFAEPRVLQPAGASVYPTSLLYSPPSVVSRVSFEEGVRTPVLQYAHPELGVQPAKLIGGASEPKPSDRREQALAYFAHDIHADRSPYAFEPGLEDEARADAVDDNNGGGVGVDRPAQQQQRPRKKTLPYFYGPSDKYYVPPAINGHANQYEAGDERPFWQRVSDSIQRHMRTSMDRVSELAAPVVDPLVEASHKISKNLGLEAGGSGGSGGGYRELDTLKEKFGLAGSPSVVLPALGLVAGGAALGLGAVAVGRYLDVDVLQRSRQEWGEGGGGGLAVEHKRAVDAIARSLAEETEAEQQERRQEARQAVEVVRAVEEAEAESGGRRRRRRRSTTDEDAARQSLLTDEEDASGAGAGAAVWASTPCAKRVFCEAMLAQSDDAVRLTDKKMATYINMLTGGGDGGDASVALHLADVMRAVRAGQCAAFSCRVAPAGVLTSGGRPR